MTQIPFKRLLGMGALCAGSALLLTACIDDSYDLDNVDLTMGLGSDGLAVKLGNTEKIYLEDILSVDESVKLDQNNLYYLVEDGTTNFDVKVDDVDVTIDDAQLHTNQEVLTFDDMVAQSGAPAGVGSINVPVDFAPYGPADGETGVNFHVDQVGADIKHISEVMLEDTPVIIKMRTVNSPNVHLGIDYLKDFTITLPEFLHVKNPSAGWTIDGQKLTFTGNFSFPANGVICEVTADQATLGEDGTPENGSITLGADMTRISMDGEVYFCATQAFTMTPGDYANVQLDVEIGNRTGTVSVDEVKGIFDPEINPAIETIDIASGLPDFLQEDGVNINVANPTLKFSADMSQIPVGINLSADLTAVKAGANGFTENVNLPQLAVNDRQHNTVYYYQADAPYDPEADAAAVATAQAQVNNISSLIEKLPDYINVDLSGRHLTVQNREYTVKLGRTYSATAEYNVYAPFEFNSGLTIVYKDSTESVGEDIKDYAAKGVRLTAAAQNTIPLNLVLSIEARDENNRPIPGVNFSTANISAGDDSKTEPVTTAITVDGDLDDPNLLKRIDTFVFRIEAASGESTRTHRLVSTQYVRLADVRIRLKGAVVADFN